MVDAIGAKVVLLGETTVGKTSIVNVIHGGAFVPDQTSTIGACFQIKKMVVNERVIKLHLWDTAGQERFRSLAPMYYRDAAFAILVYSINNLKSFSALESWYLDIKNECTDLPRIIVIGNKKDLEETREVTEEMGKHFANKIGALFYETSAMTDEKSVTKVFDDIAERALADNTGEEYNAEQTKINVDVKDDEKKKKGCC